MNVLLTGATGFVGSHVVPVLQTRGHRIYALVRASSNHSLLKKMGVQLVFGALDDPETRSLQLPEIGGVLHIGGTIKAKNPNEFYRTNTEGTRFLLENVSRQKIKSFVFVSSLSARGPDRTEGGRLSDDPVSHYGKSKLKAEKIVLEGGGDFAKVIIRPPIVYGPGDREVFTLFKMFKAGYFPVLTGGERRMSFIYVGDLAQILVRALETPSATPGPFYPEDGHRGYSWGQIVAIAQELNGRKIRKVPLPKWIAAATALANEGASKLLGYTPMFNWDKYQEMKQISWACDPAACHQAFPLPDYVSLAAGFSITHRWYKEQGWYEGEIQKSLVKSENNHDFN